MAKTKTINKNTPVHKKGEIHTDETIHTKPNQSMTIRDIMKFHTTGRSFDNTKTPYYEEEATFESESLNKIANMDPVEKLQHLDKVSTQVKSLQKAIKQDEEAKAKAVAEATQQTQTENNTTTETSE